MAIDYTPEPRWKHNIVIPKKEELESKVCILIEGCVAAKNGTGKYCKTSPGDCPAHIFNMRYRTMLYLSNLDNTLGATQDSGLFI